MTLLKGKKLFFLALILGSVCFYACSEKGGPDPEQPDTKSADRKAMLINIADNIVIPAYAKFKVKLDIMLTKSTAFTTTPNPTTLIEFRAAWVDAYIEWQRVELFDFGPGQVQSIRSFFNIYPASETGIASNIATGSSVNLDVPAAYPTQGFPALDYMLNGLGSTDAAVLSFYTTAPDAVKRIDYLKRITAKMNTVFTKVNSDWNTTYRNEFVNKTGIDASSSTSVMVNSYVLNFERYIRSGKFGIPSGAMLNGVVAAKKVEAFYKKDLSLLLAKAAQQATIDFFNGKSVITGAEGPSFKTYLDVLTAKDSSTGSALTQVINMQFLSINQKLGSLSDNLSNEVNTNNQGMIAVYTEMQKAVRLLKVDLTSAMSITISYTDNDGD
ncbi:MAG TPA: imelysin family protein [Sphingobacteriaceae bacterium]|nr:imelysin family protein [Sphingobacteriaceae bacterium]